MNSARVSVSPKDKGVCLVITGGQTVGHALHDGLLSRGYESILLGDEYVTGANRIVLESRAAVVGRLEELAAEVGTPRLIVISVTPASLQAKIETQSITVSHWRQGLDAGARAFLYALQGAHAVMSKSGGTIVCVGPAFGLVGAAGLLALSTLIEAQRALVKSAARQWGSQGLRVHWLSIGEAANYPQLQSLGLPRTPELGPPPPALGQAPSAQALAGVVDLLASEEACVLTGTTLVADGGEWMVP